MEESKFRVVCDLDEKDWFEFENLRNQIKKKIGRKYNNSELMRFAIHQAYERFKIKKKEGIRSLKDS